MKGYIFKGDIPPNRRQFHSFGTIHNIRSDVHDFTKTLIAGHTALKLLGKVNQLQHRRCEGRNVQNEYDQICRFKIPSCNQ